MPLRYKTNLFLRNNKYVKIVNKISRKCLVLFNVELYVICSFTCCDCLQFSRYVPKLRTDQLPSKLWSVPTKTHHVTFFSTINFRFFCGTNTSHQHISVTSLILCSNQQQTDPSSVLVKRKHVKHPSRLCLRVEGLIHFTELGPHTVHDRLFLVLVTFEIQNQSVSNVTLLFMFSFQQEKLLNYMKVTINRALLMKRNFCDCNSSRISIKHVNISECATRLNAAYTSFPGQYSVSLALCQCKIEEVPGL